MDGGSPGLAPFMYVYEPAVRVMVEHVNLQNHIWNCWLL